MIPQFRKALHDTRATGIDVFVLPRALPLHGEAFRSLEGKEYINMIGSIHNRLWLFVLLHEVAHHTLGHTGLEWSSTPSWIIEKQADEVALAMLADLHPAAVPYAEQASKDHIRPILQWYIDADIWHHVDEATAIWAGCTFPPDWKGVDAKMDENDISDLDLEDVPF